MTKLDSTNPKFGRIYDGIRELMVRENANLSEITAACLAWFLTFAEETVPKENRIMIVQKLARDLGVENVR